MKLSVTKSGNACGADIKFDLSLELDDRTFAEIRCRADRGTACALLEAGVSIPAQMAGRRSLDVGQRNLDASRDL